MRHIDALALADRIIAQGLVEYGRYEVEGLMTANDKTPVTLDEIQAACRALRKAFRVADRTIRDTERARRRSVFPMEGPPQ